MDLFYCFSEKTSAKTKYNIQHNTGLRLIEYTAKKFFNIENPEIEVVNEKPKFKYSDIKFSVSHSHNIVAVCFDDNEIGFDIEKILNRDYNAIAEKMNFTLKEDSIEEFYNCWTKYEAEYKLQAKAKYFYTQKFLDEYIISVVSEKTTDISNVFKIHKVTF